ncbi:DUF1624 domain-containing protein [Desulfoferrobacter suflitae]|uniref:DUF1624 domain-containing protein n=1 Tax=Desulfoferrobacter suflitae TaxID=2865782 RepID=UPI0021648CDC|nr:heparan-alpha-glucosaminide N-acetyltransferase domain-containing protein [Desulfoferrobacter suflitae]MCK8600523.1 heparan-alpha-glucosaminide N-acetyltransferase domain-containing protein [Desulfoferrobacter suflitae]
MGAIGGAGRCDRPARLTTLDGLRGWIMVLMALDHAAYFISNRHPSEFWGLPLPHYDHSIGFFTRWVTHVCAPGFFFLMGLGMVLFHLVRRRINWSESKILGHFVARGLLLVALQLAVENPAWMLVGASTSGSSAGSGSTLLIYAGVLYGLGTVMILCAALLRLKTIYLIGVSLLAIMTTQVLTLIFVQPQNVDSLILTLLVLPGRSSGVLVYYPPIAWLGLSVLGMVFARELLRNQDRAYKGVLVASCVCLVLFAAVRTWGGFGNIHPPASNSWISYLNVTKYPPSIAFLLLTMGINFFCLFAFSRGTRLLERWGPFLLTFGQSALFFYLVHLYLYALFGVILGPDSSTLTVYGGWLLGLVLLYPACQRYAVFRAHTPSGSIWRFF